MNNLNQSIKLWFILYACAVSLSCSSDNVSDDLELEDNFVELESNNSFSDEDLENFIGENLSEDDDFVDSPQDNQAFFNEQFAENNFASENIFNNSGELNFENEFGDNNPLINNQGLNQDFAFENNTFVDEGFNDNSFFEGNVTNQFIEDNPDLVINNTENFELNSNFQDDFSADTSEAGLAPIESTENTVVLESREEEALFMESSESNLAYDILPSSDVLTWVGYEYLENQKVVQIEMKTRGNPEYEVYQEQNRRGQSELVFRFLQTRLRGKIARDIDASEFRSPVAYIRMRQDSGLEYVDVVLTLRDKVNPDFYAKEGNIMLRFDIPESYFGNNSLADIKRIDQGEFLGAKELDLQVQVGSELPKLPRPFEEKVDKMYKVDDKTQFRTLKPITSRSDQYDQNGFPPNFGSLDEAGEAILVLKSFSLLSVGQDNFEDFVFEDDNLFDDNVNLPAENNAEVLLDNINQTSEVPSQAGTNNLFNNNFNASAVEVQQEDDFGQIEDDFGQIEDDFGQIEDDFSEDFVDESENVDVVSGNIDSTVNTAPFENIEQAVETEEDFLFDNSNFTNVAPENLANTPEVEPAIELTASDSQETAFTGKLVTMEFTEAPLNLVFQTFAIETQNNFIFPKEVGEIVVSIRFKDVPWDEALRAVMETHSLGMVRVGENVVRVDKIDNLTDYLGKLEKAKQFETRRVPTKVLVIRLNNAKSETILSRLTPMLQEDQKIDPRIKLSSDQRTNSIVMEAPDYVLSKARNIIERLDLETPQVEIASRIVEVQRNTNNFFGVSWLNRSLASFDPGRGLGFGTLNFPNNLISSFSVDPGVVGEPKVGNAQFRFGSINRFLDLDLILRMEERRGSTNILQSNRVLVLDGQQASIVAGNSRFFRPAAGGTVINQGDGGAGGEGGLAEVQFNLSLEVKPQVTADGAVIMDLTIVSDTPADPTGESLADKNTRELKTQMIRESGDTGVIGGIYDTQRIEGVVGVPFLSSLPLIGALFRSKNTVENQTELLIMVTPTIVSGRRNEMGDTQLIEDDPFFSKASSEQRPL